MPGLYSHTTRASGTVLTAAIYNSDHQNHINNHIPSMIDDFSTNVTEMRDEVDPGESGSESLATSLAEELRRIRFAIREMKGTTYWYQTASSTLGAGIPIGAIIPWPASAPPTGWLNCDGTAVSRTTYANLFGVLVKSATITVTIASPGVVTWTAHGLQNNDVVKFTTTGSLPTGINVGTTYYIVNKTTNTFEIAASPGGSSINTSGTQSGTHTGIHSPWGTGDDSTTFNLPDLRNRTVFGVGTATQAETVANTDVSIANDTFTIVWNRTKWITGMSVVLTTTGTAPAGLTAGNTYYIVRDSETTVKLASSLANAVAGTVIDITGQGTGAHTLTHTFLARRLGEIGGDEVHAQTPAETPAHTHSSGTLQVGSGQGSHGHSMNQTLYTEGTGNTDPAIEQSTDHGSSTVSFVANNNTLPAMSVNAGATASAGGSTAANNLPTFGVMNWVIKT
jgi:microcystin-dependent protein